MKPVLTTLMLTSVFIVMATPAGAHPHDQDKLADLREKTQELADKAREQGDALIESDLITSLTETLEGLAARVEVEKGEGNGTALWLDGDEVVRFNRDRTIDDALTVTGLGQNLSIARETLIEGGKTRTRIVIEMDGGTDVKINVPDDSVAPNVPE